MAAAPTPGDTAPALSAAPAPADAGPGGGLGVSVNLAAPAPVRYAPTRPGSPASAALENTPLNDVTPATTYTVARGDSLTRIAHRNQTTIADLMKANNLTSNSVLSVGQKLIIPGKAPAGAATAGSAAEPAVTGASYTVKAGDTLAVIAHRAGSTTSELKRINNLRSDYVHVGQELKLPSGSGPLPAETAVSKPVTTASQPAASGSHAASVKTPEGAVTHEVKPGETLGVIARKYHVRTQDLLVANNIADPRKIRPGQSLVIPGGAATEPAGPAVATSAAAPAGTAPATANSETSAPPPAQDLDSGLKPQGEVPVIKADDAGETKAP
jgi:N-acetylmuramoyl-L-alanine amidase